MSRRVLALLVVAGALLRALRLGAQPLWLDEATTAHFAGRDLWGCLFGEPYHPPLHRLSTWVVLRVFGDDDTTVRLLPALWGVLAIPLVYVVARRLRLGERVALVAAALVAASPFLLYLSQ